MFDSFKVRSIRAAENDLVTPCIPPQKPTNIMLKIGRELISVMNNHHCTYVNHRCFNTTCKNAAKSTLNMQLFEIPTCINKGLQVTSAVSMVTDRVL